MSTKYAVARDRAWQWRAEANHLQRERKALREALAELVELKELRARLEGWEAGSTDELAAISADYARRLPRAWRAAERVLERLPKP